MWARSARLTEHRLVMGHGWKACASLNKGSPTASDCNEIRRDLRMCQTLCGHGASRGHQGEPAQVAQDVISVPACIIRRHQGGTLGYLCPQLRWWSAISIMKYPYVSVFCSRWAVACCLHQHFICQLMRRLPILGMSSSCDIAAVSGTVAGLHGRLCRCNPLSRGHLGRCLRFLN